MEFKDILLVSDIDGTLLSCKGVPERNRRAVCEFINQGGRFALATGRSELNTFTVITGITPNVPCILYNGAAVYDFASKRFLMKKTLEGTGIRSFLAEIARRLPVNIQVYVEGPFYVTTPEYKDPLLYEEKQVFIEMPADRVPEGILKVLFYSLEAGVLDRLAGEIKEKLGESVQSMRSSDRYLEVLPAGADKGNALEVLKDRCKEVKLVATIGDYENDLEMLRRADVCAAPAGALLEVKNIADYIVGEAKDGAVAEFLEVLAGL